MKTIELKCCCGASIKLTDDRGTYLEGGGQPNSDGFKYIIDKQAHDWQLFHRICLGQRDPQGETK